MVTVTAVTAFDLILFEATTSFQQLSPCLMSPLVSMSHHRYYSIHQSIEYLLFYSLPSLVTTLVAPT